MKAMWRVVITIVLIMLLLGVLAAAVGFMTGADLGRIYQTAENTNLVNLIGQYYHWIESVVDAYKVALQGVA